MCSEKINEVYGAAEGLAEAAFLESDKKKSLELLKQAQNFHKIQGTNNQGMNALKKFAQKILDNSDSHTDAVEFALEIYEMLFEEAFEGDNFIWNPEVVHEYVSLLMKMKAFERAIKAKKTFIKFMQSSGQIDHQIRRAFVEIAAI